MKLIFFGGVHGVGKTTLLKQIWSASGERPHIVDPGELFWEHVYQKRDKTPAETEELVVELIERECRLHRVVVCNWHYAVWTPKGYVPEIAFHRLANLIERVRPDCVELVLISASADAVFLRRTKDRAIKKRKVDRRCIEEEIAQTEMLYQLHRDVIVSRAKVATVMFDNTGPVDPSKFDGLAKTLYETT